MSTSAAMTKSVADAHRAAQAGNYKEAEDVLVQILHQKAGPDDEDLLAEQEQALVRLGQLNRDRKDAQGLARTVMESRQFMSSIAKAKTAKLVRILIDYFNDIPDSRDVQIQVTRENAQWAKQEKRIFLKQNLETKLIAQYYEARAYREALPLIAQLLKELKTLDDKMILTEVQLLESKASLDMQSGILHADDKDFNTAASYFYETLEGFDSMDDPRTLPALKYMLLCKIMLNQPEEVYAILEGKVASKYAGHREMEVMKAVAEAQSHRSLEEFEQALQKYKNELSSDPIVRNHLSALYDQLLEQNILRVIEPYSRIELSHIAKLVHQPVREVEQKLSQMILDKEFKGVLDQGAGCLVVYDEADDDQTYEMALGTLKQISHVVDSLYQQASELT